MLVFTDVWGIFDHMIIEITIPCGNDAHPFFTNNNVCLAHLRGSTSPLSWLVSHLKEKERRKIAKEKRKTKKQITMRSMLMNA